MAAGIALARVAASRQRVDRRMNESVNRVKDCLAALVTAALVSDDRLSLEHRLAARAALAGLAADPVNPEAVRIDGAWMLAVQAAERPELAAQEGQVNLTLPRTCPFALADLTAAGFDVDAAVDWIRKSASTG